MRIFVKKRISSAHSGFSLVESVVALFLFSLAAYIIGMSCYNCVYPLDVKDKNTQDDALIDLAVKTVLNIADYDALDDGEDVEAPDGETYRVYAEAEPTQILDLFRIDIRISGKGRDIRTFLFASRNNWYERSNDREDIIKDRTDYLEDLRRKKQFNR